MKNTYNQPKTKVYLISVGQFMAISDRLQRGNGSGGNTAETREMFSDFGEDY